MFICIPCIHRCDEHVHAGAFRFPPWYCCGLHNLALYRFNENLYAHRAIPQHHAPELAQLISVNEKVGVVSFLAKTHFSATLDHTSNFHSVDDVGEILRVLLDSHRTHMTRIVCGYLNEKEQAWIGSGFDEAVRGAGWSDESKRLCSTMRAKFTLTKVVMGFCLTKLVKPPKYC